MIEVTDVLSYLIVWSLIGCAGFSVYVVVVFRTGIVYTARKQDGTLKEKPPLAASSIPARVLPPSSPPMVSILPTSCLPILGQGSV